MPPKTKKLVFTAQNRQNRKSGLDSLWLSMEPKSIWVLSSTMGRYSTIVPNPNFAILPIPAFPQSYRATSLKWWQIIIENNLRCSKIVSLECLNTAKAVLHQIREGEKMATFKGVINQFELLLNYFYLPRCAWVRNVL